MLNVLSLFAGIGGFDLGLERTGGFKTVAFCEIDPFCQRVLAKHWPGVPCYDDVRTLTAERLAADGIAVDVICGGFPCQDISCAGNGAGIEGARSGLWREYARLIGELRPQHVLVENVSALLARGLGVVLGDLAALGYDAEWHCIPASALGASHRRDRIWILAYPQCVQQRQDTLPDGRDALVGGSAKAKRREGASEASGRRCVLADAAGQRCGEAGGLRPHQPQERLARGGEDVADPAGLGRSGPRLLAQWCYPETNGAREAAYALSGGQLCEWDAEPDVGRVADGIPLRAHRLRALGNAVVPAIPELLGRAILEASA